MDRKLSFASLGGAVDSRLSDALDQCIAWDALDSRGTQAAVSSSALTHRRAWRGALFRAHYMLAITLIIGWVVFLAIFILVGCAREVIARLRNGTF